MRDSSFLRRLGGFLAAAAHLSLDLQEDVDLHAVFLSEEQLAGVFLGASIEGKQIAVQALLDWARVKNPQSLLPSTPEGFHEVLEELNA
jgi:hypothetical protein